MASLSLSEWDRFLAGHPHAHLLQTGAWGELKKAFGWQVERVTHGDNGAQVLFRTLPLGFHAAYIAKGPLGSDFSQLWPEIDRICRRKRTILLKVEPDLQEPVEPRCLAAFTRFTPSDPIQPRRTIVVSLEGSEDQWLERMKQKTRYNIRLAERKEVIVRPWQDIDSFFQLMRATSSRDGFSVHSRDYYQKAYQLFHSARACELLVAEFGGQPLAALMVFARGRRAWYLYGASNDEERNRMPAYLLQWEAMRWAARQGCLEYDLVGVPDEEEDILEAGFSGRSDGLWGVYRFKRGFGGQLVRSAGAFDRAYLPFVQVLYGWWSRRRHAGGGLA